MSDEYDRRTMLKMTTGITTGFLVAGTAANAVAADESSSLDEIDTESCECYYESKCEDSCIEDPRQTQYWERECCECDDGKTCDDWQRLEQCC